MTSSSTFRLVGLLAVIGIGLATIGVGEGPSGVAVAGMVRGDGVPLAKGLIRFVSTSGSPVVGAGAFVKAGEYAIESERGLVPGEYLVQISGLGEEEMKALSQRRPDGSFLHFEDPIPPRYNLWSKLVVKLSDAFSQRFDFDLEFAREADR